jgi:putative tryptophan/tyrosine transport system substrate-binding protein
MNRTRPITRLVRTGLAGACALALAAGGLVRAHEPRTLVVVTSRDDGPYAGVVAGARGALATSVRDAAVRVFSLQTGGAAAQQALATARQSDAPIIAVGASATRAVLAAPGSAPVIACMSADADELRAARNATGVMLEFSMETQLRWIHRFVPDSQAVGVLYNPQENQARIAEAHKVAQRLGLRLVAREVHKPQDLPGALESLAREADVLLAVTDQIVLSPQTTQAILLFSFRNRMPFSGLSSSWVKAGALYALERDYPDLGAQCAEMAVEVLNGRAASSIPPAKPRKVVYAVNVRTADQLKLRLPEELIAGAAEVYR